MAPLYSAAQYICHHQPLFTLELTIYFSLAQTRTHWLHRRPSILSVYIMEWEESGEPGGNRHQHGKNIQTLFRIHTQDPGAAQILSLDILTLNESILTAASGGGWAQESGVPHSVLLWCNWFYVFFLESFQVSKHFPFQCPTWNIVFTRPYIPIMLCSISTAFNPFPSGPVCSVRELHYYRAFRGSIYIFTKWRRFIPSHVV